MLTNSEFLRHLAQGAPRGSSLWVNGDPDWPTTAAESMRFWAGRAYVCSPQNEQLVDSWTDCNAYFSVAALLPTDDGLKRRKANFTRLLALVVDDAKPDNLSAEPSWIFTTSVVESEDGDDAVKQQIGMLLDHGDPDCADARLVDAVVTHMADVGLMGADKSGNNICRYMRLPAGYNSKTELVAARGAPYHGTVDWWQPKARYTLAQAAAAFGVDIEQLRVVGAASSPDAGSGENTTGLVASFQSIDDKSHDAGARLAGALLRQGMRPAGAVTHMRGILDASGAARDERWQRRFQEVPHMVRSAEDKLRPGGEWNRGGEAIEHYDPTKPVHNALQQPVVRESVLMQIDELLGDPKPIDWLVKDWLESNALSMLFGPSGGGKSFVTIDWACCIATGKDWHGRGTKKGPVIYVAGEGHNGFSRRLLAWQKVNGVALKGVPIYLSRKSVQFLEPVAVEELRDEIDGIVAANGKQRPVAIIIDTLARNFGNGDENKQQDAGRFVDAIDALRRKYECNVVVVHHTGKADQDSARGSSAFKGALDQEIMLSGAGGAIRLEASKMKEAEAPEPIELRLSPVQVGLDDEDAPISAAALVINGNPLERSAATRQNGDTVSAQEMLDLAVDGVLPAAPELGCTLGVAAKGITEALKRLDSWGLTKKGQHNRRTLTEHAMQIISTRGGVVLEKKAAAEAATKAADEARESAYAAQIGNSYSGAE